MLTLLLLISKDLFQWKHCQAHQIVLGFAHMSGVVEELSWASMNTKSLLTIVMNTTLHIEKSFNSELQHRWKITGEFMQTATTLYSSCKPAPLSSTNRLTCSAPTFDNGSHILNSCSGGEKEWIQLDFSRLRQITVKDQCNAARQRNSFRSDLLKW